MLNYLSLFSGIGAPEQALKNIGIDYNLVGFSEIDKFAIKSYCKVHNVPETKNLGDISQIKIKELYDIDLITHGSPCQDFSVAGKNLGGDFNSNTRSSLMWETVKIIEHTNPKYVLWENVKNVLSKKHIHNFNRYIQVMDQLGYKNFYKVLNAKNFNIPQNRERIFVISIRNNINKDFTFPESKPLMRKLKDLLEMDVDVKYYTNKAFKIVDKGDIKAEFTEGAFRANKEIYGMDNYFKCLLSGDRGQNNILIPKWLEFPCVCASRGRNINNPSSRVAGESTVQMIEVNTKGTSNTLTSVQKDNYVIDRVESDYRVRKLTPKECWRLMGFKDEQFYKAQEVCSNTQLYKQAGNSIVVNVLEEIFKNLLT